MKLNAGGLRYFASLSMTGFELSFRTRFGISIRTHQLEMLKQVQHDKLRSDIPLILPFSPRRRNIQSSPFEILRSAQCDGICTPLTLNAKRIDGRVKKLYNSSMVNVSVIIPVYNV